MRKSLIRWIWELIVPNKETFQDPCLLYLVTSIKFFLLSLFFYWQMIPGEGTTLLYKMIVVACVVSGFYGTFNLMVYIFGLFYYKKKKPCLCKGRYRETWEKEFGKVMPCDSDDSLDFYLHISDHIGKPSQ